MHHQVSGRGPASWGDCPLVPLCVVAEVVGHLGFAECPLGPGVPCGGPVAAERQGQCPVDPLPRVGILAAATELSPAWRRWAWRTRVRGGVRCPGLKAGDISHSYCGKTHGTPSSGLRVGICYLSLSPPGYPAPATWGPCLGHFPSVVPPPAVNTPGEWGTLHLVDEHPRAP